MEEQSGRELASADPTAGAQDATIQERGLSPEVPLNPGHRLQHFQRPTPPHVSSITPRATRRSDDHVACSIEHRNCEGSCYPGNRVGLPGLHGGAEGIRTEMLLEVRCLTSAIKGTG